MDATAKARSARWRDRRRLGALSVSVDVLPSHLRALQHMGLIAPGNDRDRGAVAWAVCRYLDTAPAMRAMGEALYPDWPPESEENTPLPDKSGQNGE